MHELSNAMNAMTEELDKRSQSLMTTTNTLYKTEVQKQKAEIAFLRSQINPHFLYNSLETIKGICMGNKVPEAALIANNLGKIFRYSIKGGDTVKLREEIAIARAYVDIQKIRFAHKVDIVYNFSDNTLEIPVLGMILQPLLENAFLHSVEKKTDKTTLYIASQLQNNDLVLIVQDDGVGINDETLLPLQQLLENASVQNSQHVGLANVNMRLRLMYGVGYGLSIESSVGEGTKVIARLKT